jgi:hypothetical protein
LTQHASNKFQSHKYQYWNDNITARNIPEIPEREKTLNFYTASFKKPAIPTDVQRIAAEDANMRINLLTHAAICERNTTAQILKQ